jgi:hypothetical protein
MGPAELKGRYRLVFRRSGLALGVFGFVWAATLWAGGGLDVTVFGQTLRSHDPVRPFVIGVAGVLLVLLVNGRERTWRWVSGGNRGANHAVGLALAAWTFGLGVAYATTVGGGSDSYGYLSQAELWLAGTLKVDQAWAQHVPWPSARWSFTPLGYHPSERPEEPWVLRPVYSPGLPLLLAGTKFLGGQEVMFWVVPFTGALLVLATYGMGCRLASAPAGLIGAWLVATSPAVLFELVEPMTDVPVASAWACAYYFLLRDTTPSAALAGLSASAAILIRPNFAFAVPIMSCWYVWRLARAPSGQRAREMAKAAAFAAAVLPGVTGVALINTIMNGSPARSGYGTIQDMFAAKNFWPNARQYLVWLVDSQTPLVLAGVAALFVPLRRLWPAARDRSVFVVINAFVLSTWMMYCFFLRFDAWWYLRFLLSLWPFFMLGVGAVIVTLFRKASWSVQVVAGSLLVALGVYELGIADRRNVFDRWKQDRHYASVGRLVRNMTEPNGVIMSMQYSGSLRYYGGRLTMRWDILERQWLDPAIGWLAGRGIHTYLLVSEWELPEVERRFAGQRTLEKLKQPVVIYRGPVMVLLYDLSRPDQGPTPQTAAIVVHETYRGLRSVPPAPLPPRPLLE